MFSATSVLARHWPFANGSGRILDKFGTRIDLGSGKRIVQTSDGFSMHVYADDLIGRHLLLSGKFDRSIIQVLLDLAEPGDTLLDIGANIGYYSAVFLSRVENSKAICFEPQPGIVDLLETNVGQFGSRAAVHQVGLADRNGELRFHIDQGNRAASRISSDGETSIPVCDAREVFAGLERVDLMKIDVEGFEEPIFRAVESELARLKPRAILFEDQTAAAAPEGALGSILTRAGYRVRGIDKRLLKTRLVPVFSAKECRFNDYLAELRT
jgi:FkbM family methyltransferase